MRNELRTEQINKQCINFVNRKLDIDQLMPFSIIRISNIPSILEIEIKQIPFCLLYFCLEVLLHKVKSKRKRNRFINICTHTWKCCTQDIYKEYNIHFVAHTHHNIRLLFWLYVWNLRCIVKLLNKAQRNSSAQALQSSRNLIYSIVISITGA